MNLEKLTKKELLDIATKKKIKGRTTLSKAELVEALAPFYKSKTSTGAKSSSENLGYTTDTAKKPVLMPKKDEYPIPDYYNSDTLVLLPVDPAKEYVYWEISSYTFDNAQKRFNLTNAPVVLKIFKADDNNQLELASIPISMVGNWFFTIYAPESLLWSEIGFVDANGKFYSILRSASIRMPADKISPVVDEETWMTIGKRLDDLYALSGVGKHDIGASKSLHQAIVQQLSAHNASSSGFMKDK